MNIWSECMCCWTSNVFLVISYMRRLLLHSVTKKASNLAQLNQPHLVTFELFTAVRITMMFFWVLLLCRLVSRCHLLWNISSYQWALQSAKPQKSIISVTLLISIRWRNLFLQWHHQSFFEKRTISSCISIWNHLTKMLFNHHKLYHR